MNKIKIFFSKENYQEEFIFPIKLKENLEVDLKFLSNTLFSSINEKRNVILSSEIEQLKIIFTYEFLKDKCIKIVGEYE